MAVGIIGLGAYVPERVVTNATIAEWTGATMDWIDERTGILERRYAEPGMPTSAMGAAAVRDLASNYPEAVDDVGAIIVSTSTPDQPIPATAACLQRELGIDSGIAAFDVNAVCSGFLYAIEVGAALVERGTAGRVLVVAADKYSAIMDPDDRRTVSLFGDAAGAVVLGPVPDGHGLRAVTLYAHGAHRGLVEVPAGGTRHPIDAAALEARQDKLQMDGRAVTQYVMATLPDAIRSVLDQAGEPIESVSRWVFHQANPRLLAMLAKRLGVDPERVPITARHYGNTGSASIAITLHQTNKQRPVARGETLVLGAVGAGMTGGAAVLTWY